MRSAACRDAVDETNDLTKKARDCREAAKRARAFVESIGSDPDGMYLRFAQEQERRATELEAVERPLTPAQVTFEQSKSSNTEKIVQSRSGPLQRSSR